MALPLHSGRPRAARLMRANPFAGSGRGWTLDLRLIYDSEQSFGWVSGSAYTNDGDQLVELPDTELAGLEVQDDVITLLRALWDHGAGPRDAVEP